MFYSLSERKTRIKLSKIMSNKLSVADALEAEIAVKIEVKQIYVNLHRNRS